MVGREAELLGGGLSSYLQFLKDGGCFEWEKELWVQPWAGLTEDFPLCILEGMSFEEGACTPARFFRF